MKAIKLLVAAAAIVFSSLVLAASPVNINTADAKSLSKELKGIGLAKAEAIVQYRTDHGQFTNIQELSKVKGIGKSTIEKNKEFLLLK